MQPIDFDKARQEGKGFQFPGDFEITAVGNASADLPPMGMRVRLKAGYAIPAGFSTESRAILQAMKTYGMLVADNGSNWFVSGAPDDRWDNDRLLSELGSVKGSDFEVVRMDGMVVP